MVARPMPTQSVAAQDSSGWGERLFKTWRLSLTRLGRGSVRLVSRSSDALSKTARSTANGVRATMDTAADDVRGLTHDAIESTTTSASAYAESITWLYGGWRRAVTRVARVMRNARFGARLTAASSVVAVLATDTVRFARTPSTFGTLEPTRASRVARLGLGALIVGIALGLGLGWVTGLNAGAGLSRALGTALWACARLVVLLALAPRGARLKAITLAAWSASLLPYLAGLTEGLRVLALVASAYLCFGALRGSGVSNRDSRTMTAWAFGGHAGVTALGWALRGMVALLAAL